MNKDSWSSESIKELASALAKAQAEIVGAQKNSSNTYFNSDYANLHSVWDAFREPFTKNGLSLVQFPVSAVHGVGLESILMHESGEWMKFSIVIELGSVPIKTKRGDFILKDGEPVFNDMWNDPQKVVSAITYLRRTCAASIAGVPQIDDDGESLAKGREYESQSEPINQFGNGQHNGGNQEYRSNSQGENKGLPIYPGSELSNNKDKWVAIIKSGDRTPEQIIAAIKTKYSLSAAQESTIKALGATK